MKRFSKRWMSYTVRCLRCAKWVLILPGDKTCPSCKKPWPKRGPAKLGLDAEREACTHEWSTDDPCACTKCGLWLQEYVAKLDAEREGGQK